MTMPSSLDEGDVSGRRCKTAVSTSATSTRILDKGSAPQPPRRPTPRPDFHRPPARYRPPLAMIADRHRPAKRAGPCQPGPRPAREPSPFCPRCLCGWQSQLFSWVTMVTQYNPTATNITPTNGRKPPPNPPPLPAPGAAGFAGMFM